MTIAYAPKPGLARRGDTYQDTYDRCRNAAPDSELNRLMIDKALFLGTADRLTPQERCVLAGLLAHLDVQAIASGRTAVWPGAERLCQLLGMAKSTLRRLKASLEDKGFLLRKYDQRNRPLHDGAIDLKPFLLLVPTLLAEVGHTERALKKEKAQQASERSEHDEAKLSTEAPRTERPIRNLPKKILVSTACGLSKTEGFELDPLAQKLHAPLAECPVANAAEATTFLTASADQVLGEGRGARLMSWALRRHGAKAALALAVAAESPKIRDRAAWFGWFATSSEPPDLEANAQAILAGRSSEPIVPEAKEPFYQEVLDGFVAERGEGPAAAYLTGAAFKGAPGDPLTVVPRTKVATSRLETDHAEALQRAAKMAGFTGLVIRAPRRE